jgi:hypothetical protein
MILDKATYGNPVKVVIQLASPIQKFTAYIVDALTPKPRGIRCREPLFLSVCYLGWDVSLHHPSKNQFAIFCFQKILGRLGTWFIFIETNNLA